VNGAGSKHVGREAGRTSSVRARYMKNTDLFDDLRKERGIEREDVLVAVGDLQMVGNFSQQILVDVETLLIHQLQPYARLPFDPRG
jgi:hypothetical protein